MSVNLEKHREEIVSAWKDVLDDKSDTNWVLYGYEGASNDLKVVDHGSGGLDELVNELNSGKIMYAFARVEDSKTSLSKSLLINWQGEGAPVLRKGTCANHLRDIVKILTGAHLTINARTDDDVDVDRIMAKLSATGSAYNFKKPVVVHEERPQPIGTAYSRVVPAKEINTAERDSFWRKEEEEEKRRVALEVERKQQQLVQSEKEWRAREEKEHVKREQIKQSANAQSVTTSPSTNADFLRQQRNKEARELIGGRVGTSKAVFTQQLCPTGRTIIPDNGETSAIASKAAPAKPVRNSIAQRINSLNNPTESVVQAPTVEVNNLTLKEEALSPVLNAIEEVTTPEIAAFEAEESPIIKSPVKEECVERDEVQEDNAGGDQFSTIKRSPHTKSNDSAASTPAADVEPPRMVATTQSPERNCGTGTEDDIIYQDVMAGEGLKARALYDYQAADESEITFDPGDLITHIDQIDEGWWQGLGPDGAYGLFPANYVELLP